MVLHLFFLSIICSEIKEKIFKVITSPKNPILKTTLDFVYRANIVAFGVEWFKICHKCNLYDGAMPKAAKSLKCSIFLVGLLPNWKFKYIIFFWHFGKCITCYILLVALVGWFVMNRLLSFHPGVPILSLSFICLFVFVFGWWWSDR